MNAGIAENGNRKWNPTTLTLAQPQRYFWHVMVSG